MGSLTADFERRHAASGPCRTESRSCQRIHDAVEMHRVAAERILAPLVEVHALPDRIESLVREIRMVRSERKRRDGSRKKCGGD
jgi:hypothetical protein